MTPYPLQIFLCHSIADKPLVRELYSRLKADGYKPWLDEIDILPGQDWQREIPIAVRASDIVLVCLSPNAVTKEGYIHKEIRFALDAADEQPEGDIFIIPVRVKDCVVPPRLSRWQWVNLYDTDGYERLRQGLARRKFRTAVSAAPVPEIAQDDNHSFVQESDKPSVRDEEPKRSPRKEDEKRLPWALAISILLATLVILPFIDRPIPPIPDTATIEGEIIHVDWGCEETRPVHQEYTLKPGEEFVSADWILLNIENAKGYNLPTPQFREETRRVVGEGSFRGFDRIFLNCPAGGNAKVQMQVKVKLDS